MVFPILVTVPFGDADQTEKCEEREALEDRLAAEMLRYVGANGTTIEDLFNFYPYRNPNPRGVPLSPAQLLRVLTVEMDLFVPEVDTPEELATLFPEYPINETRAFAQPLVSSDKNRYTEAMPSYARENVRWDGARYVLVVDDVTCRWTKLFHVDDYNVYLAHVRKFHRQGKEVRPMHVPLSDDLFEGIDRLVEFYDTKPEDRRPRACEVCTKGNVADKCAAMSLPVEGDRCADVAAAWLGVTEKECILRGIEATYLPVADDILLLMCGIQHAGTQFRDVTFHSPSEVDDDVFSQAFDRLGRET